jgi:FG-GAP-like repeat
MNRTGARLQWLREHHLLSAVAVVVMLVAGLLTLQVTVAPKPEASAASSVGGSITRAEVIARAKYWYDRGDTWYSQDQSDAISDGDGHKYRPDCSGLVAMAWHLPKKSDGWDLNTDDFHTYSEKTFLDSVHDLLPGDALLKDGHIELFEKWVDAGDHTDGAWVYSENTFGQKTNHNVNSWSEMNIYRPIRYDRIVEKASVSDGGDFNADGVGDIFSSATGTLTVWNGRGDNKFAAADAVGPGWSAFSRPIAGDFNGDGITDLAAVEGGSTLNIWNGRGGNRFNSAVAVGPGWGDFDSTLFSLGDVNGDGRADIGAVKEGTGTLYVWNGRGDNKFGSSVAVGPGWGAFSRPIAGDFDGDGISDLAAVEGGSTLNIWNGRGGNKFSSAVEVGPGWGDYDSTLISLGDVNGDGRADIGAVKEGTGTLFVWNGRGDNKFGASVTVGTGWTPYF